MTTPLVSLPVHPSKVSAFIRERSPLLWDMFQSEALTLEEALTLSAAGITAKAAVDHYLSSGSLLTAINFQRWISEAKQDVSRL